MAKVFRYFVVYATLTATLLSAGAAIAQVVVEVVPNPQGGPAIGVVVKPNLRVGPAIGQGAADAEQQRILAYQRYLEKMGDREQTKRRKHMDNVLNDLRRFCRLNSEQVHRLEVAAKGAIEYSMQQWHDQMQKNRKPGQHPAAMIGHQLVAVGPFWARTGLSTSMVVQEPIWTKTIERVLTDEQRTAYTHGIEDRLVTEQAALVKAVVAQFAGRVKLTAEQRRTVEPIVAEAIKEPIKQVVAAGYPVPKNHMAFYLLRSVPSEKWKDVLTEAQMKKLKQYLGPEGRRIFLQ